MCDQTVWTTVLHLITAFKVEVFTINNSDREIRRNSKVIELFDINLYTNEETTPFSAISDGLTEVTSSNASIY